MRLYSKTSDWASPNHYLILLGLAQSPRRPRSRSALAAVPVGLNALAPTPKVRPSAPPAPPKVRFAGPLLGRVAASAVAVATVLLLTAAPASALSKHIFETSFAGTGANALSAPGSVEIDQSNGDVYVSDTADYRVEKFTANGEFILMFGKGVDKTTGGNVCTAESGDECQAGTPGSSPGAFDGAYSNQFESGASLFLAVDNSCASQQPPLTATTTPTCEEFDPSAGDLYVGDPGDALVSKFDPAGHLLTGWGAAGRLDGTTSREGEFSGRESFIHGIAVDPTDGDLLVAAQNFLYSEFDQSGSYLDTVSAGQHTLTPGVLGIALDRAHDVYSIIGGINGSLMVQRLGPLQPGAPILRREYEELTRAQLPFPLGSLALDPATDELYATAAGEVLHYCAAAYETCPLAESFGAGHLSEPHGLAVDSATGAVYVANTGEHDVAIFKAVPYLPAATPTAPTEVTATAATLTGTADPAGAGGVAACHFQSAPAAAFANQVQTITLSAATGSGDLTKFSNQVTALDTSTGTFAPGEPIEAPGIPPTTTVKAVDQAHHTLTLSAPATASGLAVALAAKPDGGTFTLNGTEFPFDVTGEKSSEESFEAAFGVLAGGESLRNTGPPGGPIEIEFLRDRAVPLATTDPSGLTPPGSTVTITSDGAGGGWAAGATTALCQPEEELSAKTPVTAALTSLAPGTSYRFRLSAANSAGADTSFPEEFTTYPQKPTVGATSAAPVSATSAQIHVQIAPGGGEAAYHASYRVEYVTQAQFEAGEFTEASLSPSLDAGSAHTAQPFTVPLNGLSPDTVYHYRVTASNECEAGVQCQATGPAHTLTTLPLGIAPDDPCPNAHVRQQTGAALASRLPRL